ncbi:hypothetical protein CHS0354_020265 [Potamilus streckersoni]|uniref:Uncharacterized protein n=1 Tax=Potamilus streckersoni TaxID=2493646 RepID=A0AAE0S5T3_9BIVA|nr:hypothetical protein CHS0354_020265 [Potamilus streckersoni]
MGLSAVTQGCRVVGSSAVSQLDTHEHMIFFEELVDVWKSAETGRREREAMERRAWVIGDRCEGGEVKVEYQQYGVYISVVTLGESEWLRVCTIECICEVGGLCRVSLWEITGSGGIKCVMILSSGNTGRQECGDTTLIYEDI